MGLNATKAADNPYYKARKEASKYNERLSSREGAAEQLNIHPTTLADYELGLVKPPVDKVVRMADLYNAPSLKTQYCANECPIGCGRAEPQADTTIEQVTIRLMRGLSKANVDGIKNTLLNIAEDGRITDDEKPELQYILAELDYLQKSINELRLIGEKCMTTQGGDT